MVGTGRVMRYTICTRQPGIKVTFALAALTGLLIACSNLFLVSQRLSIQNGAGGNLLSIRDVLLAAILASTLTSIALGDMKYLLGNSLAIVSIVWALYSLSLAYVGYMHGNAPRDIIFELMVVWGGLVGIPVLTIIKTEAQAKYLGNVFTVLGILVALGVFAEIYLRVPVVTGGTSRDSISAFSEMVRPVPTGGLFLIASTAFLLARIVFDKEASWSKKWLMLAAVALELTAGMLTESRSIQVTEVFSFLAIWYLRRVRGLVLGAILVGVGAAAWMVTLSVGNRTIGPQFTPKMEARYSVFDNREASQTYYKEQLRPMQIRALFTGLGPWAIWGSGLGDDISQVDPDMPAGFSYTDVSFVYLATRFGLIGDAIFVVFTLFAFRSLIQIRRNVRTISWVHAGFAATLCGLIVASFSANLWETTYSAIPTSIAYFVVLGLNRRHGRRAVLMIRTPALHNSSSEGQVQCLP